MTSTPLEHHGVVGDMRTLALVAVDGTIDWMCWPRFDSGSVFASLLDEDGGSWALAPVGEIESTRQSYLSATNVLVTRFHTADALVEIEDWMSVGSDLAHLVRTVRCHRGSTQMRSALEPRPDFARHDATIECAEGIGTITADAVDIDLTVSGSCAWDQEGAGLATSFTIEEGDVVHLVLGDSPLDDEACEAAYEATTTYWRRWTESGTYRGRWREAVERSALTLKMLTHAETGGIIAAGTTSLPEAIGGERNWDYRYVWIRDAAFTVYAFIRLGHLAEARAFTDWLVARLDDCAAAAEGEDSPLAPLYDLDGVSDLTETELDGWSGWRSSPPVRVGNAASGQLQLDIFGELVDALYLSDKYGDGLDHDTWNHVCTLISWLCDNWRRPDDGMWEARSGPRRHTSSLLMSWVAVERAMRMSDRRGRPAPMEQWRAERDAMHVDLLDHGWNEDLGAFTQVLDGDTVDASILLAPLVKFISPTDPRWLSTLDVVGDRLAHGPLVDRYDTDSTDDGLDGDEGSFTICSFWHVEALARSGRVDEARVLFDRLLSYASPTGLFSEEIGSDGRQLGNMPQAFTHLALISAALALDDRLDDGDRMHR